MFTMSHAALPIREAGDVASKAERLINKEGKYIYRA